MSLTWTQTATDSWTEIQSLTPSTEAAAKGEVVQNAVVVQFGEVPTAEVQIVVVRIVAALIVEASAVDGEPKAVASLDGAAVAACVDAASAWAAD